jgi:hypothetical protein
MIGKCSFAYAVVVIFPHGQYLFLCMDFQLLRTASNGIYHSEPCHKILLLLVLDLGISVVDYTVCTGSLTFSTSP